MSLLFLKNGIPHDAIILTNSSCLDEFKPSKVFSVPSYESSLYPWEIEIHLSGSCFLSCKGCSYSTRHSKDCITIEDLGRVFYSIKTMGSNTLFFSGGGDPLYWDRWEELITLKQKIIPNTVTGISTNLITINDCGFMNSFFDFIQIHVVGFDDDSCRLNTNVDCFEIMDKHLKMLTHNNIVLKVLVNSDNRSNIAEYLTYLSNFNAKTIVLKMEQSFTSNEHNSREDIWDNLIHDVENHPILSNYKYAFFTKTDEQSLLMPSRCHMVAKHLYCLIRENGEVFPCVASSYSKTNSVGNIRSERLETIFEHNIDDEKFTMCMKERECPLGACRHFRFNQEIEKKNGDDSSHLGLPPALL